VILLAKLEKYVIQGNSLELFKSYLKDRKQVCSVNGKVSAAKNIKCGVPQGSNLGSILLYINDLPTSLKTSKHSSHKDKILAKSKISLMKNLEMFISGLQLIN
jgi:hypothetical protein